MSRPNQAEALCWEPYCHNKTVLLLTVHSTDKKADTLKSALKTDIWRWTRNSLIWSRPSVGTSACHQLRADRWTR
jgi:hypothetical protein